MKKRIVKFWLLGTHPIMGVVVEKVELTDTDPDFLDEKEEWLDFDDYVHYNTTEATNELEQRFFDVILMTDEERKELINKLSQ